MSAAWPFKDHLPLKRTAALQCWSSCSNVNPMWFLRAPAGVARGCVTSSVSAGIQRVAESRTAAPSLCLNGGGPRGHSRSGVVPPHSHRVELCSQGSASQEEPNVCQIDPSRPWGRRELRQSRIPAHHVPQTALPKMVNHQHNKRHKYVAPQFLWTR